MYFTRYEIRHFYERCIYEGGDDFDYVPFDTCADVLKYISSHKELKTSDNDFVCVVKLFSDYDSCKVITTTKNFFESKSKYCNKEYSVRTQLGEWKEQEFQSIGEWNNAFLSDSLADCRAVKNLLKQDPRFKYVEIWNNATNNAIELTEE